MSDTYIQICFLLASAGFRERELAEFALEVKENGPAGFVEDVLKKRSLILADSRSSRREENHRQARIRSPAETLASKVIQLLVEEAKMTKLEASEALRQELENRGHNEPPPLGKRGFAEWLGQLSRLLPPSEILHISTRIRNQHVHQGDTDWSLK